VTASIRIERERAGGVVARVTLDRPDVHNAFNATVIAELRAAFAALAREGPTELRAVVLAGAGPSFCAGADVTWMRAAMQLDVEGNEQDAMAMADMFETIDTCPAPVVARVHGAALGGGMGLCAVSDIVIAESGARFGFTETRLGILPASSRRSSSPRSARATPARCSRAAAGSMRSGRSGSGSSTRSSRARRPSMLPWTRP
jgi:methylglutaconyl-CoA hydratase